MMPAAETELIRQALRAAGEVAGRLGATPADPVLLHHSQHISVLLPSMATVARVRINDDTRAAEGLEREIAVVRHLSERRAPVVTPSTRYPAGPHAHGRFAMTLWRFVEHVPFDDANPAHMADAAAALRRVHEALADYPDELPSYRDRIDACGTLLADGSKLPALADDDRRLLLKIYERLVASLASLPVDAVPIHGDAQTGNVLITPAGALWTDFESASRGPREWDIGYLPDVSAFEPIDHDLHAVLSDLRSLCVSVWCWALAHRPDKREAAEYHLAYLKAAYVPKL